MSNFNDFQDLFKNAFKSTGVGFKDFSRQLLKFKAFSRLYKPWNHYQHSKII